jgi:hypothetical protein
MVLLGGIIFLSFKQPPFFGPWIIFSDFFDPGAFPFISFTISRVVFLPESWQEFV